MFSFSKAINMLIPLLYAIALATVVSTAHITGYEDFLKTMTKENGFFELLSVVLFAVIFIYGVQTAIKSHRELSKVALFFILSFSLIAFLGAMEEISWGQSFFHFESSDFFIKENLQKETNLHNLIAPTLFSSIIYFSVYTFFIFIPLLYKLFCSQLQKFKLLHYFDINPHTILVTIFASVFQIYFYNTLDTWSDMATHLIALLLFGYYLLRVSSSTLRLKLHYGFLLIATTLSMWSYEVYRFKNMQYEIRESFVVLAGLLLFMELIEKEKKRTIEKSG